jgi:hypothetical protein
MIRVGEEFCEVNYITGHLTSPTIRASVFTISQKEEAELELSTVLESTDYKFVRILKAIDYIM